jgi:hypothetical protein
MKRLTPFLKQSELSGGNDFPSLKRRGNNSLLNFISKVSG